MALKRLIDLPLDILIQLVPLMQKMYEPANVTKPEDLGTETGRQALAMKSGKNLVVVDFESALAQKKREMEND